MLVAGDEAFTLSPRPFPALRAATSGQGQHCRARGLTFDQPALIAARQQHRGGWGRGVTSMAASSSYEAPARSIMRLVLQPSSSNSWHDMGMLLQVPSLTGEEASLQAAAPHTRLAMTYRSKRISPPHEYHPLFFCDGWPRQDRDRLGAALVCLEKAAVLSSRGNATILSDLGHNLRQQGRYDDATAAYRAALEVGGELTGGGGASKQALAYFRASPSSRADPPSPASSSSSSSSSSPSSSQAAISWRVAGTADSPALRNAMPRSMHQQLSNVCPLPILPQFEHVPPPPLPWIRFPPNTHPF